ncbi:MAG TPA: hypothetical protein VGB17_06075 [Pyrinomonadaceae bacterium]
MECEERLPRSEKKLSYGPSRRAEPENSSCVLSLELYLEDKTSRQLSIKGYKAASLNVVDRKECKKIQRYESVQKLALLIATALICESIAGQARAYSQPHLGSLADSNGLL